MVNNAVLILPEIILWFSVTVILYTLLIYPLISLLIGAVRPMRIQKRDVTPTITLIIAAYNEQKTIREKLEQSLQLDYPADKLQIVVADDGSTDRTAEIASSFSNRGVELHQSRGRQGKTAAINGAIAEVAQGEILVFTDATSSLNSTALRALASNFADPTVGCVSGRVMYRYTLDVTSKGFEAYQRFTVAVRRAEGSFGSLTSVSGAIHAMRASLFEPSPASFTQDLSHAIHTVSKGYRVVYEYDAIAEEESRNLLTDELESRIRISMRENGMLKFITLSLWDAKRYYFFLQFISHKIMRWWLWAFLLLSLISNILLIPASQTYANMAVVQSCIYTIACLCAALERDSARLPGASTLAFFVTVNIGMLIGAFRAYSGGSVNVWEPIRKG